MSHYAAGNQCNLHNFCRASHWVQNSGSRCQEQLEAWDAIESVSLPTCIVDCLNVRDSQCSGVDPHIRHRAIEEASCARRTPDTNLQVCSRSYRCCYESDTWDGKDLTIKRKNSRGRWLRNTVYKYCHDVLGQIVSIIMSPFCWFISDIDHQTAKQCETSEYHPPAHLKLRNHCYSMSRDLKWGS